MPIMTPAVTPLHADGTINAQGANNLYEHLLPGGMNGILVLGSIGVFFAVRRVEETADLLSGGPVCQPPRPLDHRPCGHRFSRLLL